MLLKLALGNVRRSARDFSIYFMTLAFAVCLLYSFLASTDYLLALDLSPDQRLAFSQAGGVLQAFAVFIDVIFCFLLGYANAFLLRRRRREFGTYLLLGMGRSHVALVLMAECALAGTASLVCGLLLGWLLSPVFSLIAAFVFGAPWRATFAFSMAAAGQCAVSFAVISAVAAVAAVRGVWKRPLVELMGPSAVPERRRLSGGSALRAQKLAAAALLALVWGMCLLNPGYFIVFIIPMGFVALFGSYFLIRVLAVTEHERINGELRRFVEEEPGCYLVSAEGLTSNPDGIHIDAASQRRFGVRYYRAFAERRNVASALPDEDELLDACINQHIFTRTERLHLDMTFFAKGRMPFEGLAARLKPSA